MSKYQHQHTFQIVEKGLEYMVLTIILKTSKLNANGREREKEWLKKDEKHVFYQKTFDTYMYFISFRFILFFALNEITEWSVWKKRWITKATNGAAAIKKSIHLAHTDTEIYCRYHEIYIAAYIVCESCFRELGSVCTLHMCVRCCALVALPQNLFLTHCVCFLIYKPFLKYQQTLWYELIFIIFHIKNVYNHPSIWFSGTVSVSSWFNFPDSLCDCTQNGIYEHIARAYACVCVYARSIESFKRHITSFYFTLEWNFTPLHSIPCHPHGGEPSLHFFRLPPHISPIESL